MYQPQPEDPITLIVRIRILTDSAERSHSPYDFQTLRLALNDLEYHVRELEARAGRAETVEADMVDWALAVMH